MYQWTNTYTQTWTTGAGYILRPSDVCVVCILVRYMSVFRHFVSLDSHTVGLIPAFYVSCTYGHTRGIRSEGLTLLLVTSASLVPAAWTRGMAEVSLRTTSSSRSVDTSVAEGECRARVN